MVEGAGASCLKQCPQSDGWVDEEQDEEEECEGE